MWSFSLRPWGLPVATRKVSPVFFKSNWTRRGRRLTSKWVSLNLLASLPLPMLVWLVSRQSLLSGCPYKWNLLYLAAIQLNEIHWIGKDKIWSEVEWWDGKRSDDRGWLPFQISLSHHDSWERSSRGCLKILLACKIDAFIECLSDVDLKGKRSSPQDLGLTSLNVVW